MRSIVLIILVSFLCIERPKAQGVIKASWNSKSLMNVDYESLVSKADLSYNQPARRSEEGMPVGNGRMGSLVWTTPSAMHFQINRVDVFAMGCNTNNFPDGDDNYSFSCGYVDINMVDYGADVFSGEAFSQHLSVYEGLTTTKGNGIKTRVIAWNDGDVIATEIDDQRDNPPAINIDLRMLRYSIGFIKGANWDLKSQHAVQIREDSYGTPHHTATSRLDIRKGRIILIQEFREGEFYSSSAVAIGLTGRRSKASFYNESTVRLSAEPGKGTFSILTSSASSSNPEEDVADLALKQLEAAQVNSFDELVEDNRNWWGDFWSKSFVHLHSEDGVADFIEKNYTYYQYIMASCSRGDYQAGFRGMLWYTNGDMAKWGSQYWWHNQGFIYHGLTPANRPELLEPVFSTYSRNYESFSRAAHQQWGSKGIWIPETTWFDGLEDLPDHIAKEMRELYLVQKPWEAMSEDFRDYSRDKNGYNSRWNWRFRERRMKIPGPHLERFRNEKTGPFAYTSHIFSTTAKISYMYWLRYAYYLDKEWLRTTGYPMIKGTVEFYRNFPNLYKAEDGKYHIRYVNNLESQWGGTDPPEELSAMHAMFPIAIRASEVLGVDAELRPAWKEILDNLAPVPPGMQPAIFYDLVTVGSGNNAMTRSVVESYKERYSKTGIDENVKMNVGNKDAVVAANLGRAEHVKYLIPSQMRGHRDNYIDYKGSYGESEEFIFKNRLSLREGPGAIECQRLGQASNALLKALLQSVPPTPGEEAVNYVFPAWPKEWDARFTLAARDAFLISASMKNGDIEFVEIHSQKGGLCRLLNPWPGKKVNIHRDGTEPEIMTGQQLSLQTEEGETIVLIMKGKKLIKAI